WIDHHPVAEMAALWLPARFPFQLAVGFIHPFPGCIASHWATPHGRAPQGTDARRRSSIASRDYHSRIDRGAQRPSRGSFSDGGVDHFGNHHYLDGDETVLISGWFPKTGRPNNVCNSASRQVLSLPAGINQQSPPRLNRAG